MEQQGFDYFGLFMLVFYAPIIFWYVIIATINYTYQDKETLRLNVLSTRTAFALPIYATVVYISLLYPPAFPILNVFLSFAEGANLQSFFCLLIVNMDGPNKTVKHMIELDEPFCLKRNCGCCCKCTECHDDKLVVYKRATWWMFHVWFTRTLITLIGTVLHYIPGKAAKAAFLATAPVNFVILIFTISALMNIYANIHDSTENLFGELKLVLIKSSAAMLVILDIVQELIAEYGGGYHIPQDNFSDEWDVLEFTKRAYCCLMLAILLVYAIVTFRVYTTKIVVPSHGTTYDSYTFERFSYMGYNCALLNYFDIIGILTYRDDDQVTDSVRDLKGYDSVEQDSNLNLQKSDEENTSPIEDNLLNKER